MVDNTAAVTVAVDRPFAVSPVLLFRLALRSCFQQRDFHSLQISSILFDTYTFLVDYYIISFSFVLFGVRNQHLSSACVHLLQRWCSETRLFRLIAYYAFAQVRQVGTAHWKMNVSLADRHEKRVNRNMQKHTNEYRFFSSPALRHSSAEVCMLNMCVFGDKLLLLVTAKRWTIRGLNVSRI